jgi:hypothetical protein
MDSASAQTGLNVLNIKNIKKTSPFSVHGGGSYSDSSLINDSIDLVGNASRDEWSKRNTRPESLREGLLRLGEFGASAVYIYDLFSN